MTTRFPAGSVSRFPAGGDSGGGVTPPTESCPHPFGMAAGLFPTLATVSGANNQILSYTLAGNAGSTVEANQLHEDVQGPPPFPASAIISTGNTWGFLLKDLSLPTVTTGVSYDCQMNLMNASTQASFFTVSVYHAGTGATVAPGYAVVAGYPGTAFDVVAEGLATKPEKVGIYVNRTTGDVGLTINSTDQGIIASGVVTDDVMFNPKLAENTGSEAALAGEVIGFTVQTSAIPASEPFPAGTDDICGADLGITSPFTPNDLYVASNTGDYFDFTDSSTMYQDVGGTTAADTSGDVVRRVESKRTGATNGAGVLTQTSADRVPINSGSGIKHAGTTSNVDYLDGSHSSTANYSDGFTLMIVVEANTNTYGTYDVVSAGTGLVDAITANTSIERSGSDYRVMFRGGSNLVVAEPVGSGKRVLTIRSNDGDPDNATFYVGGVSQGTITGGAKTTWSYVQTSLATPAGTDPDDEHYRLVAIDRRLTDSELTDLEAWGIA